MTLENFVFILGLGVVIIISRSNNYSLDSKILRYKKWMNKKT